MHLSLSNRLYIKIFLNSFHLTNNLLKNYLVFEL